MTDPYPKSRQLARGERRYRRKVASPKQWAAIRAEKLDAQPCRICDVVWGDRTELRFGRIELHHLVPRSRGGDDVAANLVALCWWHHDRVTRNVPSALRLLEAELTDQERAYVIGKLGEGALERLFGVGA